jgi:hypothetical protein
MPAATPTAPDAGWFASAQLRPARLLPGRQTRQARKKWRQSHVDESPNTRASEYARELLAQEIGDLLEDLSWLTPMPGVDRKAFQQLGQ